PYEPHKPAEGGRRRIGLGLIAAVLVSCLLGGAAGGVIVYNALTPQLNDNQTRMEAMSSEMEELQQISTSVRSTEDNGTIPPNPTSAMTITEIAEAASPAVVAIGTKALKETAMGYQTVM